VHRRCLPGDAGPQPGDPAAACSRRALAAPAGVERRGGAAEASAGAAVGQGHHDQRLECGAELRRGSRADGVSCALASDSEASGRLRVAERWGAGGDSSKTELLRAVQVGLVTSPAPSRRRQPDDSQVVHSSARIPQVSPVHLPANVIMYLATREEFLQHVREQRIEGELRERYIPITGHKVAANEFRAWQITLQCVGNELQFKATPRELGLAIEYRIHTAHQPVWMSLYSISLTNAQQHLAAADASVMLSASATQVWQGEYWPMPG
jgi:hypothetical protein